MDEKLKAKINKLANLFYKSEGYNAEQDYDFSEAYHPQEKGMWNKALTSYCFWNGKTDLMKYQI